MREPRGHYDMYGAARVSPDCDGADVAFLFMHNEGYSTMCGHAVIALGRYLNYNHFTQVLDETFSNMKRLRFNKAIHVIISKYKISER